MADVKISGLPSDSSLDGNHYVPLNDPTGPTTKRTLLSTLAAFFFTQANIPAGDGSPITRTNENNNPFAYSGGVLSADSAGVNRNGSMTAAVIYINGKRLSLNAVSARTYTASKDTYVFVDDTGTITYSEQTAGTVPALPANSICLGLVVTNGSTITKIIALAPRNSQEIARAEVVLGGGDLITCPFIPARNNLQINMSTVATGGTLDTNFTFNNDTGTNYGQKYYANFTTATDATNAAALLVESGATVSAGTNRTFLDIMNTTTGDKAGTGYNCSESDVAADTTAPRNLLWSFVYDTATQITRMDLVNGGTGDFGIGSMITVRGNN